MALYHKGKTIAGGGSAGEIYSTEEQRIGTWIDGKPIYRKVQVLNKITLQKDSWTSVCTLSGALILKAYMTATRSDGMVEVIPGRLFQLAISGGDTIKVNVSGISAASWTGGETIIIIEYTKTTD